MRWQRCWLIEALTDDEGHMTQQRSEGRERRTLRGKTRSLTGRRAGRQAGRANNPHANKDISEVEMVKIT